MPQVYQTYVTQIANNYPGETSAIRMLEQFSPVAASMSKMALYLLQSDTKKEKVNSLLQNTFQVNKRHANSVINFVGGTLLSASECHKAHIEILDAKIKSVNQSIENLNKRLKAHRQYAQAQEKYNLAIRTTQKTKAGKFKKAAESKKMPSFEDACPINGKPHGKTYLQLAKQQLHQKKRPSRMYLDRKSKIIKRGVQVNLGNLVTIPFVGSTGESNSNQICQLTPDCIPRLKIRVPYFLSETFGEYVNLPLYKINAHGYDKIVTAWALNNALTYVFSKNKKGKWVVAITCLVNFALLSNDSSLGYIGLDINPGSIGWCTTNHHGNPMGWGKINLDLHSSSTDQTVARLSQAVSEITLRALATRKPIVIEKLDFDAKKKQFKRGRKYNRMLSGFAYAKFFELLKSRCLKLGIKVIEVSPKYSSQIGVVKYMRRYSMGSDSAAALVLARRGMGIYHEKLLARYAFQTSVHPEARQHVFAHWQRFNSYYKKVGFRNSWFAIPNLTGSTGDGSVNTVCTINSVVKGTNKASARALLVQSSPSGSGGVNPSGEKRLTAISSVYFNYSLGKIVNQWVTNGRLDRAVEEENCSLLLPLFLASLSNPICCCDSAAPPQRVALVYHHVYSFSHHSHHRQYCVGFGEKGKGKRRRKFLYPKPSNLFPKPDSELKILNRAVLASSLSSLRLPV